MSNTLCITFRFIQPLPLFHGRADAGTPEWPPSPLRVFQALLNATGMLHRGRPIDSEVRSALCTLETIRPHIVAPEAQPATVGYRSYVPHNQADLVTAAWDRGNLDANIASHRMEKDVRPMRLAFADDGIPAVHYLYSLDMPSDACQRILKVIRPCVRSITALGWGIDQIVADATLLAKTDSAQLEGQPWRPASWGSLRLRVHCMGTLDALLNRHQKFVNRLVDGNFTPVPPIAAMDVVPYRRDTDPAPRPYAAFKFVDENDDTVNYPQARLVHIAGMVRHRAIVCMKRFPPGDLRGRDPESWVEEYVAGHQAAAEKAADAPHAQFSFVPLQSIGHEHTDPGVRRVIIIAPFGDEAWLAHLAEQLDGELLKPLPNTALPPGTRLQRKSESKQMRDGVLQAYTRESTTWASVTPVILDGHVKKKRIKSEDGRESEVTNHVELICRALKRAGIEQACEFEWNAFSRFGKSLSAHKYDRDKRPTGYIRPDHLLTQTAVHVTIRFSDALKVPGPIAIGAGRHCGLGVFASREE